MENSSIYHLNVVDTHTQKKNNIYIPIKLGGWGLYRRENTLGFLVSLPLLQEFRKKKLEFCEDKNREIDIMIFAQIVKNSMRRYFHGFCRTFFLQSKKKKRKSPTFVGEFKIKFPLITGRFFLFFFF